MRWTGKGRADSHPSHILVCCYSLYVCYHNSNYYCPSIDMSYIPVLELAAVDCRNETSWSCPNASIYYI